jgi:hypothetical protein
MFFDQQKPKNSKRVKNLAWQTEVENFFCIWKLSLRQNIVGRHSTETRGNLLNVKLKLSWLRPVSGLLKGTRKKKKKGQPQQHEQQQHKLR